MKQDTRTHIEAAYRIDGAFGVFYRFQCNCWLHGEWRQALSEAEQDADRHRRDDHGDGKAVA